MRKIELTFFIRLISWMMVLSVSAAYAQRYPVSTSINLVPPYPVDLTRYAEAGSDKLVAAVVFNDFSQTSWNVKLRLTIESGSIRLQTNTDLITEGISLVPGVPEQLTGFELAAYLNYDNMIMSGISRDDIIRKGGLPDGHYSFSLEALDFRTSIVISNKATSQVWLISNDPPQITYPRCGERLPFSDPQNIAFQWLPMHLGSPNSGFNTEYEFTLVEIPQGLAANEAVVSGMPLLTTTVSTNTFQYSASEPQLENGKQYAFRIRATDSDNLSLFKNQGYSEVCWFTYGYPVNGSIALVRPEHQSLINVNTQPVFTWNAPDNIVAGQPVSYELRIVEATNGIDPNAALAGTQSLFEEATPEQMGSLGYSTKPDVEFAPDKTYAWQVKAFTYGVEIASTPAALFRTTPLVQEFNAGPHVIQVVSISNQDLQRFSGTGRVKVRNDGTETEFTFANLRISSAAGKLLLADGEIIIDVPESIADIELAPDEEVNGSAYFRAEKIRITRAGMTISGVAEWPLPFPQQSGQQGWVRSESSEINYDNLRLNGYAKLNDANNFTLLDPFGFDLKLTGGSSNFFLRENRYTMNLDGVVTLPANVRSSDGARVTTTVSQIHQLFYNETTSLDRNIAPINGHGIELSPVRIVIDLSETKSPSRFATQPAWKGAYFDNYSVLFLTDVDRQLKLYQPIRQDYKLNDSPTSKAWVDNEGLAFALETNFSNSTGDFATFNRFNSNLTYTKLVIEAGQLTEGVVQGEARIPVLEGKYFPFTIPVDANGFEDGYLDEGFTTASYTFNKGAGAQELSLSIVQAVFADNERLDAVIDLRWDGVKVAIESLDGFHIYGNGLIGFGQPNGSRDLPMQQTGSIDNYPITVKSIRAGYQEGQYVFSTTAEIVLAQDFAGKNGPPEIELLSVNNASLTAKESEAIEEAVEETKSVTGYVNFPIGIAKQYNESGKLVADSLFVTLDIFLGHLEGFVKLTHDDPDWGTSFQGVLNGMIRVPVNANVHSTMIIGRKDDVPFFFYEAGLGVGGPDRGSDKALNAAHKAGSNRNGSKDRTFPTVARIRDGIPLGPLSIVGGDFRFYYHMRHSEPGDVSEGGTGHEISFEPDATNDYGVYGRVAMRDLATQGEVFNMDVAFELARSVKGSLTYGFEGNIEIGNSRRGDEPGVDSDDVKAARKKEWAMTGTGKFVYNQAEQHYIGDFWLVVATPALCAEGGLAFEMKPNYWKVSLGTPDRRIIFTPGCKGWSPTGYLIFDPNEFELGLGVALVMGVESPWIGPSVFKFKAKADFALSAGIVAGVQVRPSFQVKKAGVWAEVNAALAVDYETWLESGTWVLASVGLSGNLTAYFEESTRLEGTLTGELQVLGFDIGFEAPVNHTL